MRNLAISPSFLSAIPQGLIRLLQDIMSDRRINTGPAQKVTIASHSFTIPVNYSHFVITASGVSTDLNSILGGLDGDLIFLKIANNSNAVVFKHGVTNLLCNGSVDLTVSDVNSMVMAHYDGVTSKWRCVQWPMG